MMVINKNKSIHFTGFKSWDKVLCFYFLIVFSFSLRSQPNLVPNGGFENISNCIDWVGSIYSGYVPNWNSPTDGSPDTFDTCTNNMPNSGIGYQYSHSGNGYAGEVFRNVGTPFNEYIQVHLDSTLINNKKYCVSYYINLANRSGLACNNFGVYFSDTNVYVPTLYNLPFTPQINDTNIVSDTIDWVLISGIYTAQGGEKYMIIGNFFPYSQIHCIVSNTSIDALAGASYYYIDDVSLIDCTNQGVVSAGSTAEEIEVFPNPASNILTVKIKNNTRQKSVLEIKDMLGQNLYIELLQTPVINIDVSHYPSGIYFINIKNATQSINKKFIKE